MDKFETGLWFCAGLVTGIGIGVAADYYDARNTRVKAEKELKKAKAKHTPKKAVEPEAAAATE